MAIKIGIIKESPNNETRVAIVPEICQKLSGSGVEFVLQKNSGLLAGYHDSDYGNDIHYRIQKMSLFLTRIVTDFGSGAPYVPRISQSNSRGTA